MDPFFTPLQALELQAGYYGVPKADRRSMDILTAVGLDDKKDAYVRQLSGGMKRRLMVAKALVHNPPVLILDEPTAGVDVELRRDMWQLVERLRADGVTIILTTQYIEEAEAIADLIGVIRKGELLLVEEKARLMNRLGQKELSVELAAPLEAITSGLAEYGLTLGGDGRTLNYGY